MSHKSIHATTQDGTVIPLGEGVFGRDGMGNEFSFVLDNKNISRVHARFFLIGGIWYLEDYNSIHGTYVNGKKLKAFDKYKLVDKDQISFSLSLPTTIHFR
ncbi:MAG: FHA domain-containing protein [Spirochaetota bacterium]